MEFVGELPISLCFLAKNRAVMPERQCRFAKFFAISTIEKYATWQAVALLWQIVHCRFSCIQARAFGPAFLLFLSAASGED